MFALDASNLPSRSTGKERDAEIGLDYLVARYYSGAQGRFLSWDECKGGPDDALLFSVTMQLVRTVYHTVFSDHRSPDREVHPNPSDAGLILF